MTDEQRAAIDESYRCFVIHLIAYNVRQARDERVSGVNRFHACEFLRSDLCIHFIRLLGFGGSMTDAEIARSLIAVKIEGLT